jgi:hypothetical protein
MPVYTLTPKDALFFRDGRPMQVAGGHGARWPEPSLIFDALHAALHRAFPDEPEAWEHRHRYGCSSDRDYTRKETQRFGSLKTAGLFPVLKNGNWLFPSPLDVVPSVGATLEPLRPLRRDSDTERDNLPLPLGYSLGSHCVPSKVAIEPWWSKAAYEDYLRNVLPAEGETKSDTALLAGEWITGIRIDPETETTGQGKAAGQIYSAEYLRLRSEVRMGFVATLPVRLNGSGSNPKECIGKLLGENGTIVVGGQQRVCSVAPFQGSEDLCEIFPRSIQINGDRVKWVLLTPAVYPAIPSGKTKNGDPIEAHPGGWLPTWVDRETGRVKLLAGPGKEKAKRLNAIPGKEIEARLVAARIPKPIVITGWSEKLDATKPYGQKDNKGVRPTLLAVPAGAVYYFEGKDAPLLADALSWHGEDRENAASVVNRRSTVMGEKGFGLGVCGSWDFF